MFKMLLFYNKYKLEIIKIFVYYLFIIHLYYHYVKHLHCHYVEDLYSEIL